MKKTSSLPGVAILCAGVFGLAFFALAGAMECGYVFDDGIYIIDNIHLHTGLTRNSAAWAFTTFYSGNWHPLTWISLASDMSIYRGNPAGLHLTNVLLHAINSALLVLLFLAMTGSAWRSALAAALFAVHPLRVESVVWITERKDVLSMFFGLLAIWAYLGYSRRPSVGRWLLVALCLTLGLMAKPMLVTLPLLLLLLDFWPLGRSANADRRPSAPDRRSGPLLREKLPLLVICAASGMVTFAAQREWGNLTQGEYLPFSVRAANAAVSYAVYIRKMLWSSDLAAYYPHPETGITVWQTILASTIVLLATYAVCRFRRSAPHLFVGWLWYLVAMLPMIGLVQVGNQAMADRYTYLPMIGLLIALVWSLPEPATMVRKAAIALAAAVVIGFLIAQTRTETRCWRDDVTLFTRALKVTSRNWMAHYILARALGVKGDYSGAHYHLNKALDIYPEYEDAQVALGVVMTKKGTPEKAAAAFRRVLSRNPRNTLARVNLATALAQSGHEVEAARVLDESRRLDPKGTAEIIRRYRLEAFLGRPGSGAQH